jgi:regulator of sirC expression with transglutaminase-like and TPR domain
MPTGRSLTFFQRSGSERTLQAGPAAIRIISAMTQPISERELTLLVSFLDDPNPRTADLARGQLRARLAADPGIAARLAGLPRDSAGRAAVFLEDVRWQGLEQEFQRWGDAADGPSLEAGVSLLAQFNDPGATPSHITSTLDHMAADLDDRLDAAETDDSHGMDMLRHFLFDELGFTGNHRHYYDPENSYIDRVLARKTGIPISLSCVVLLLAERLELPAYGVGLPGHFLVGTPSPGGTVYFSPFFKGRAMSYRDCETLVHEQGIAFSPRHLAPVRPAQILFRMTSNLISIYADHGDRRRTAFLERVRGVVGS